MSAWVTFEIDLPTKPKVTVHVSDVEEAEYRRTGFLPDSVGRRVRAQLTPEEQKQWDLTPGRAPRN